MYLQERTHVDPNGGPGPPRAQKNFFLASKSFREQKKKGLGPP